MTFGNCLIEGNSCEEHEAEFTVVNNSGASVYQYRVDGCLITNAATSGPKKCDFLFEVERTSDVSIALYVELKRGWHFTGFSQILATANHPTMISRHELMNRIGVIAGSPQIPAITPDSQNELDEFTEKAGFSIQAINTYEV
jgi:hypothetical protein